MRYLQEKGLKRAEESGSQKGAENTSILLSENKERRQMNPSAYLII